MFYFQNFPKIGIIIMTSSSSSVSVSLSILMLMAGYVVVDAKMDISAELSWAGLLCLLLLPL